MVSQVPVIAIDSAAYGKLTVAPWNIIKYNLFGSPERGPGLYGTEPWNFYILNLFLNFNVLVPLALMSLPALAITYVFDRKRLEAKRPGPDESSPFSLLGLRLLPFYLWLGILTLQPHKEERFMFPAYPLLCFNAAVTIYLIRGWQEVAYISITQSPYRVSSLNSYVRNLFSNGTVRLVEVPFFKRSLSQFWLGRVFYPSVASSLSGTIITPQ